VERYRWTNVAQAVVALYEELLAVAAREKEKALTEIA
jgi:hypothetical protein